jgi:hypothetical protein
MSTATEASPDQDVPSCADLSAWIDISNEQNVMTSFQMVSRSQGCSMDQQGWGLLFFATFRTRISGLRRHELSWNAKRVRADNGMWIAAFDRQQSTLTFLKLGLKGSEHSAIQQPLPAIQFKIFSLKTIELVRQGVLPRDVPIGGQN